MDIETDKSVIGGSEAESGAESGNAEKLGGSGDGAGAGALDGTGAEAGIAVKLEAELGRIRDLLVELGGEFVSSVEERIFNLVKGLIAQRDAAREETGKAKVGFALEKELDSAGAKSVRVVRALLDMEKIGLDESGDVKGLDEQIRALKKSDPYLFEGKYVSTGNAKSLGRTIKSGDGDSLGKRLGMMGKRQ